MSVNLTEKGTGNFLPGHYPFFYRFFFFHTVHLDSKIDHLIPRLRENAMGKKTKKTNIDITNMIALLMNNEFSQNAMTDFKTSIRPLLCKSKR